MSAFDSIVMSMLANLELPGAVLGVLDDLDARVLVAEDQGLLAVLVADLGVAPLLLEQLEERVAGLGVRPPRQREADAADDAAGGGERDAGRRALPFRRQQRQDELAAGDRDGVLVGLLDLVDRLAEHGLGEPVELVGLVAE